MKKVVVLICFLTSHISHLTSFAQSVYISEKTEISFFSKAPIEDIDAVNKMSTSIITLHNDSIAFKVPITGFVFKDGLMQRHFNSNYMESDKKGYENATLKGKINEKVDFKTDGEYKVTCTGILKMHGVEQPRTFEGVFTVKEGKINLTSKFKVLVADHKIKIPSDKLMNIGKEIEVSVSADYKPYVKP
ncbi:MAG: hypothetical protein POELPBGB_01831 [Bacteroidia bacterium]|nr:hypothetical protein [Bacteroidia bacterium]